MRRLLYLLEVSRHMTILFTCITEQILRVTVVQKTASTLTAACSHATRHYLLLFDIFKPEQEER